MAEPGPVYGAMGRAAYELSLLQPFIPTYIHLIVSAVVAIYAGAHASLFRPSSAADPQRRRDAVRVHGEEENYGGGDEEEDDNGDSKMEGMDPSDAIWFPVFAGMTLGGLYFLLKWLEDPAILNKLLNWYFSVMGVLAVGKLLGDGLSFLTSHVFPRRWGSGPSVWHVNVTRKVFVSEKNPDIVCESPLPGWLSRLPIPAGWQSSVWTLRVLVTEQWTLHVRHHGATLLRTKFGFNDVFGIVLGLVAVAAYNFVGKPWWLTNLMGFGFSYGALQLMSPTTFWTGTMILGGLFFYDIYFVFFTPLMVTVAKSLDVPIKLLFPRPAGPGQDAEKQALAMLGLGDVVLPGIMIGLALRFDLYLFYLRKQVQRPGKVTDASRVEVTKARYATATGGWGERFWTRSAYEHTEGGAFPKVYFTASVVGYVVGMVVTLGVMQVWGHAQPALLYLVPGVLSALWGTALARGEVKEMWAYTERSDDEAADSHPEKKEQKERETDAPKPVKGTAETTARARPRKREILSVVITAPPLPPPLPLPAPSDTKASPPRQAEAAAGPPPASPDASPSTLEGDSPAEKRRRVA